MLDEVTVHWTLRLAVRISFFASLYSSVDDLDGAIEKAKTISSKVQRPIGVKAALRSFLSAPRSGLPRTP